MKKDIDGHQTDQQIGLSTAISDQTELAPQDKIHKTAPPALLALVPSSPTTSQINGKTESPNTAKIKASFSTEWVESDMGQFYEDRTLRRIAAIAKSIKAF